MRAGRYDKNVILQMLYGGNGNRDTHLRVGLANVRNTGHNALTHSKFQAFEGLPTSGDGTLRIHPRRVTHIKREFFLQSSVPIREAHKTLLLIQVEADFPAWGAWKEGEDVGGYMR